MIVPPGVAVALLSLFARLSPGDDVTGVVSLAEPLVPVLLVIVAALATCVTPTGQGVSSTTTNVIALDAPAGSAPIGKLHDAPATPPPVQIHPIVLPAMV